MSNSDCYIDAADGVLMVVDQNKGNISVTNDIENVVAELQGIGFLVGQPLIYRDSERMWDGVKYNNDGFVDFVPIREKDAKTARAKALQLRREGKL